ncbi:hypothetical protein [Caldiplasma sukawensis]
MNNGRTGHQIRNTEVMQAIDQILFESPELRNSIYLMHRKQIIAEIEDEGERAPPLSTIITSHNEEGEENTESPVFMILEERMKKMIEKEHRKEESDED